ncbi:MAG: hypothetical protein PHZ19_10065 [Candidatus Thermoplasmatota archaeon]|nr:hypothetical protein [Candidatus Thermoplasmatota archaeon]
MGENPLPPGSRVYVDLHFEAPVGAVPTEGELASAELAEGELRACVEGLALPRPAHQVEVRRRGSVVRFAYTKQGALGELDLYLPFCLPQAAFEPNLRGRVVEVGRILPWYLVPVPAWVAALGLLAGAGIGAGLTAWLLRAGRGAGTP